MKKVVSSMVAAALIMLAGCGSPTPPVATPNTNAQTPASTSGETKAITMAGVGGKIEAVVRDYIAPKFTEKTGIKVNFIAGVSGEVLSKVELQKNAPEIDVAMYVPLDVERARKGGLAEELDSSMIPNMAQVDNRYVALDKIGVPVFGYSIAPAINTKTFEAKQLPPIQSWNDIIRPEYKGKTAYSDISNDWGFATLYILAKANGGSMDNLEPGLEKAKDLAAYSDTFYKNSTQMIPALQQGIADVTVMGSYTIAQTADAGVPLKMIIPKEGIPLQASNATIVKNSPNKKAAQDFINFMVSEEVQRVIADNGFYPTIKGVSIPDKYIPVIGMKDSDPVYKPDVAKLSESRNMWSERWIKEVNPQLGKKVVK